MTTLPSQATLAATALIVADFQTIYPGWMAEKTPLHQASFDHDVAKETQ
jgi:hypothetical protein